MSEQFFERNLAALKECYPALAARIESLQDVGPYEIMKSPEEIQPNLLYRQAGSDILLYGNGDPSGGAQAFLDKTLHGSNRFLVLLGFGLGHVAQEIMDRSAGSSKIIIIEKDPALLKAAMQCRDLTPLMRDGRVRFIVGCEEQDLYSRLYDAVNPHFPGLKEMKFLPWPASIRIATEYYDRVVQTFRLIIEKYAADRGNDPYDTLVAYEQFFANIGDLMRHPGAGYVKDLFKGRPAVVVATGPSLKKNIHLLKEIENSVLMISADASLRILHQHNIHPHMVTTIERPPGFDAYYNGLRNLDQTVFASVSFVHPSTLKAYTGPVLFFHRIYRFMLRLGFEEDAIPLGMSTANMAYEVARHMGCTPIILVGNDLAFDSTGHTHAPGFILGEKQPLYDDFEKIDVPGNYHALVKTCGGWLSCIKEYEKRIEGWAGKLINATEGGARIRGAEVMTLKQAISDYCGVSFHPRETLLDHMARWKNPRSPEALLQTVNRYLAATESFLEICRKLQPLLDEPLRDIEAAQSLTPGIKERLQQMLPHVETVLNGIADTELMEYFEEYVYSDIFPLLMEWQVIDSRFSDPHWAKAYRIKVAGNFIGGLGQLCISLREVLLDGRKRLLELRT